MIYLTEKAANQIKLIADEQGIDNYCIRVKCKGGGCGGMTHDINFDSQIIDTDEVVDFDDVKIVIDQISWQYLENVCIDYVESTFGGGFSFTSPDIKSTCGCGKSVSY
jgi:iron-sulfur cluster assembly accessory protein